jgi:hypothetical protein
MDFHQQREGEPYAHALEAALRNGVLSATLEQLVNAVLASSGSSSSGFGVMRGASATTLRAALQQLGDAWTNRRIRIYGMPPQVMLDSSKATLDTTSATWRAVRASPVCEHLNWQLLRCILRCFEREQLRPTSDLILGVCEDAFRLKVDIDSLLAAVAMAPKGACQVAVRPGRWAQLAGELGLCVANSPEADTFRTSEATSETAAVLVLLTDSNGKPHNSTAFPPYHANVEATVEWRHGLRTDQEDIVQWLRGTAIAARAAGEALNLALLLALANAKRLASLATPTVGTLLWVWEKTVWNGAVAANGTSGTQQQQAHFMAPDEVSIPLPQFMCPPGISESRISSSSFNGRSDHGDAVIDAMFAATTATRNKRQDRYNSNVESVSTMTTLPTVADYTDGSLTSLAIDTPISLPSVEEEPHMDIIESLKDLEEEEEEKSSCSEDECARVNLAGGRAADIGDGEAAPDLAEVWSNGTDGFSSVEAFILCFKDDLLQGRPLYVNQVNNIFKIRSGGRELNYKRDHFSKLSEFVRSIPNLDIVGTPPTAMVRLVNRDSFLTTLADVERTVNKKSPVRGTGGPAWYQKQPPVPARVLERLRTIFNSHADQELSATELLKKYAEYYQPRKLRCQPLGYPSVHAVLSQVHFVEKVGGRRSARYRLKDSAKIEADFVDNNVAAPLSLELCCSPQSNAAAPSTNADERRFLCDERGIVPSMNRDDIRFLSF